MYMYVQLGQGHMTTTCTCMTTMYKDTVFTLFLEDFILQFKFTNLSLK